MVAILTERFRYGNFETGATDMRAMTWLVRRLAYLLFLAVFVFSGLELACRFGLIANDARRLAVRTRAEQSKPFRVLLLGDSFSVEDLDPASRTPGNVLRDWFAERGIGEVSLAIVGYGPPDELDSLELFESDHGDYHPNLLILNYYVGNDLTDTMFRLQGAEPRVGLLRYRYGRLMQRSHFLRWFLGVLRERKIKRDAEEIRRTQMQSLLPLAISPPPPARTTAARHAVNPFLVDVARGRPPYLLENALIETPEAKRAWVEVERILKKMADYARSQNARFVINIFPDTLQVNDSHYQFLADLGFEMDKRMLTSTAPQDLLKAFCQREGVVCNDLLPAFKQSKEECYQANDDHWDFPGQKLAVQAIEAHLVSSGLLTPR
jgi:hypothetical protein